MCRVKGLLQRKFDVATASESWKDTAEDDTVFRLFSELVQDALPNPGRDDALELLRQRTRELGATRGW